MRRAVTDCHCRVAWNTPYLPTVQPLGFSTGGVDASHRRGTTLAKLIRQERGKGLRHGHWREVKETGRNFLVDADGRQFSRVVFHLDKTLSQIPYFRIPPFHD